MDFSEDNFLRDDDFFQDLDELRQSKSLNVWSISQERLEEQACKELEKFAAESCGTSKTDLEDGELIENVEITEKVESPRTKSHTCTLDINSYIKKQEELKKHQDYKRSLQVSEFSKIVANKISKLQNDDLKVKKRLLPKDRRVAKTKKIKIEVDDKKNDNSSGSEYLPSDEVDSDFEGESTQSTRKNNIEILNKVKDDGLLECYQNRLEEYYKSLEKELKVLEEYRFIGNGLKIPVKTWIKLYNYQKEALLWLWKLHQKCTGGLLGDEMGLGKTVQIIAFLQALHCSRLVSGSFVGLGPTLIVCPATVLHQWVKHFHDWSPEFRVVVLHQSGSYTGNKNELIKEINKEKGILIATYSGILQFKRVICEHNWHYLILDEGHKIRNPETQICVAVKEIHTPHRILLTGSPMQNNLQELWSLFDFINPGMLGTLPTFLEHFAGPIMQGGYINATPMQEATALSVATVLKDTIDPFLLRRTKNDVRECISLPNKSEQVLFCSLTEEQRDLYKGYLMSDSVGMILGKDKKQWYSNHQTRAGIFVAIMTLRKICNHPDLYLNEFDDSTLDENLSEDSLDYYKRSGKMVVVSALLKIWKCQGHRALLFSQGRAMVAVFEKFLTQQGYKFMKMDGCTSISSRQPLINKFNSDSSYDVFLLTTRVGGIGVNLTGANRVIIYDPDWNPATDTQARERAWRIGQDKQVTIYRLITAGTIEEKMYQRQVWKLLLSNKVLLDPKTQKFFKSSNLHDLFSLQEEANSSNPETANIFKNSRINMQEKFKKLKEKKKSSTLPEEQTTFSNDKVQEMKTLAQQISKNISQGNPEENHDQKSGHQRMLEEERKTKLKEKEYLKTLTPSQLHKFNRKKMEHFDVQEGNKLDDFETNISFENALNISENTSKLYRKLKPHSKSVLNSTSECSSNVSLSKKTNEGKKRHKNKMDHVEVDETGKVDGEHVEGLIKAEIKKEEQSKTKDANQDEFILQKLFNKKGVYTALEHDVIVQSDTAHNSLRINSEAKAKADQALAAIRKSRLNNWKW